MAICPSNSRAGRQRQEDAMSSQLINEYQVSEALLQKRKEKIENNEGSHLTLISPPLSYTHSTFTELILLAYMAEE